MADVVLGLVFVSAALAGWLQGFVRQVVGLALLVAGAAAAFYANGPVAAVLKPFLSKESTQAVDMAAAVLTFLAVVILGNIVAEAFYRRVPFLAGRSALDGALGAAFSIGLRALEVSVVLIVLDAFYRTTSGLPISGVGVFDSINRALDGSAIAAFLRSTTVPFLLMVVGPLVPEAYRQLLTIPRH